MEMIIEFTIFAKKSYLRREYTKYYREKDKNHTI